MVEEGDSPATYPCPPSAISPMRRSTMLGRSRTFGRLLAALLIAAAGHVASASPAPDDAAAEPATALADVYLDRSKATSERLAALRDLLALRDAAAALDTVPAVEAARLARLLDVAEPPAIQENALAILVRGDAAAANVVMERWEALTPRLRERVGAAVATRRDWAEDLLRRLEAEEVTLADVPARTLYELRVHPVATVAAAARTLLDSRRSAARGAIEARIDTLAAGIRSRPGDAERGKRVFEEKCSACHPFGGTGTDHGPDLSAVGLLGVEYLLEEIVAPGIVVAGAYVSYFALTKDGTHHNGVVRGEDDDAVVLRNQDTIAVLRRDEIARFASQGVSLMPEGLDTALSPAELSDLIALLAGPSDRHVALDLRLAASADSSRGLFTSTAETGESLPLRDFGRVEVDGVPYHIVLPADNDGRNVLVLRGGPKREDLLASSYPLRAELRCGVRASAVHVLGAVGGWGYPETPEKVPVLSIVLRYADGGERRIVWRNGEEIASPRRRHDVPGSEPALRLGLRQVRHARIDADGERRLRSIVFESSDGPVAPLVLAVTVERPQ